MFKQAKPRQGRKKFLEISGDDFLPPRPGLEILRDDQPTVSPWATFCRASGAMAGRLRCCINLIVAAVCDRRKRRSQSAATVKILKMIHYLDCGSGPV
jgi:hypothetical protein